MESPGKNNFTNTCYTGSTKLRLMCSNGGHIVPRPHDKYLRYIGGDTRMVVVDRHTTLPDLTRHLSKTLVGSSCSSTDNSSSFTLKYQLPSEDLDSLISLTTDEDLENMIDEYERLNSINSSSRLRLFIFPANPESGSSIGSFLENSIKSEYWFFNALNGSNSGFSDTSSVNCLLDLDDEISIPEKKDVCNKNTIGTNLTVNNSGQDVHSIPDSPMMETTSSFGSASSTPSHDNLPAIGVNSDDLPKIVNGRIEDQFSQMGGQKRHHNDHDDAGLMDSPAPVVASGSPVSSGTMIQDHSDPFLFFHERSDHEQKQSAGFNFNSIDSFLSDLTITDQSSPVSQIQSSNNQQSNPNDIHDQNTKFQILQQQNMHNPPHSSSMTPTQLDSACHQLHHHQPQFIPPPQYIHHHPSVAVPVTSYYHHPPTDQQNFMYYIPARPPPQGYNFLIQQPQFSHADTPPVAASQAAMKTELPVYKLTDSGGPQLVRVSSNIGYSQIHQPTQNIYFAKQGLPPLMSTAQYQKLTSNSHVESNSKEMVRIAQP